jgi:phenylpropionate dioxygenase-like ring-hydroxylating dioxygenase large terminal subunit
MTFIRNLWYVAAWSHELADKPLGTEVIGEPIVLWRRADGTAVALEDRCPHRHAPLSLGRIEGADLRCMYHGLRFGSDGVCLEVPGNAKIPPRLTARAFPVVERWGWVWVWPGDPAQADPARVPACFDLDQPQWAVRRGMVEYAADYELVNDNLCDLSHLDFVHENTLGRASGSKWATELPRIESLDDGLRFERWFVDHALNPGRPERVDTWSTYRYLLPGLFLLETYAFPPGTAEASGMGKPDAKPIFQRIDQQSVTPLGPGRTRYLWAFAVERAAATPAFVDGVQRVVRTSFDEDHRMIEAQQRIWNLTPERPKSFLPQDQGPAMFRRMIAQRLAEERT